MSNLINKVKDAVSHDKHSTTSGTTNTTNTTGYDNPRSTNDGPHASNMANKADPRVDSDRDSYGTQHGTHGTHGGLGGTTGTTGAGYGTSTSGTGYDNPRSTNQGPHSSNLMNTADPRVDSDRDGRGIGHGNTTSTTGAGGYGTSTTHGTSGGYGTSTSTNAGPHDSNLMNKADPRIDSDRDGRGTHNTHGTHGTHGTHSTTSGTTGIGGTGVTPGSGRAPNTAGPHNSDMLNKLDPRVDADMDGSKTYGGNKTHQ